MERNQNHPHKRRNQEQCQRPKTYCRNDALHTAVNLAECRILKPLTQITSLRSCRFFQIPNPTNFVGPAFTASSHRHTDHGVVTEGSQVVAILLSPSENEMETPRKIESVNSPRSLVLIFEFESLVERARLLQPPVKLENCAKSDSFTQLLTPNFKPPTRSRTIPVPPTASETSETAPKPLLQSG